MRIVSFNLIQVYDKINKLVVENLKIKAIELLKNERSTLIENSLREIYKQNQYSVKVDIDSYEITLFWKKMFVVKLIHGFGSDIISICEFRFWNSFGISTFEMLENSYSKAKSQIEEITNDIDTNLIPFLPKF